ncbi:DUF4013 domain-containing protein [Halorientalis litorea]|uniref:DUF4013 domain-containing protein n=1 Tax=Halorientalis litorea TaxID=2931977 RepID=UPI001FF10DE3|nr:DUF4013 domain-containing protein [Halorientalis litorea]
MIERALRYPTESDEWLQTVAIGGVLTLFGFLLFPLFLVYGYAVRVVQERTADTPEPPVFENWGALLVDGLQVWVVSIVYLLVPLVVGAVTIGGSIAAMATGTNAGVATGLAGLGIGLLATTALSLLFGYVAVAAIVNFARTEEFGAAFDFEVIRAVILDRDYAVAWLVSVAVLILAGAIAGVLNSIPFPGAIISAFVGFYALIVAASLWADGFERASSEMTPVAEQRSDESAI